MFDEDDNYIFNSAGLHSLDEDERRWAIIHVSSNRLEEYESILLNLLSYETSYDNHRHIVRALGKIGKAAYIPVLMHLLHTEEGLILGDIAEALGRLQASQAREPLEALLSSPLDWVAQQSRWALKRIPINS